MGCVCCSLSSFVSIVLNALERISLCTVCAMLVCCLLFTLLAMLVIGIGIGFHYCTVQNSVEAMEKAAQAAGSLRSGSGQETPMMRSVNKAVKRGFVHRLGRRELADVAMPSNNNTINDAILAANITAFALKQNDSIQLQGHLHGKRTYRYKRGVSDLSSNNTINSTLLPIINYSALNETVANNTKDALIDALKPSNKTMNDSALFRGHLKMLYNTFLLSA